MGCHATKGSSLTDVTNDGRVTRWHASLLLYAASCAMPSLKLTPSIS